MQKKVRQKTLTKEKNTVIDSSVDVNKDVDDINAGNATRSGNEFTVNGRTYGFHPETGTLYPISGPGFTTLDRGGFNALGIYNDFGFTPQAEMILAKMGIPSDTRVLARSLSNAN